MDSATGKAFFSHCLEQNSMFLWAMKVTLHYLTVCLFTLRGQHCEAHMTSSSSADVKASETSSPPQRASGEQSYSWRAPQVLRPASILIRSKGWAVKSCASRTKLRDHKTNTLHSFSSLNCTQTMSVQFMSPKTNQSQTTHRQPFI